MKHKNNIFHKAFRYCWEYTESYLATWPAKIGFLLAVIFAELLSAYIIAAFDVGLKNMDFSIGGMLNAYRIPAEHFPWGIFLLFTLCILFMAVLVIWKNGVPPGGRNFKLSKSNVYGSGREINQRELRNVADVTNKDNTTGTILGQLDDTGKQVIAAKPGSMPNNNMLVFGPPGAGKSTSYVKTYITQAILRRESVIASDTKGEVFSDTVELARRHGYRVLRLDLKDPAHSNGWNVLKELRHDDVRALIFAQTVMANSGNERDNFAAPQESLLKACCLYQERHPALAESQRTFYHAFALLLQGAETLDTTITSAFNDYGECMQVVADAYATFLQGSPNLRGNIITGLANRLQILASPPVREMTSTDEIDFASIGKEPTILYISLSDQHQTMSFLASLAFSFAFLDLVELADSLPGQKLPIPVHFMMEEFGNIGRVPAIDKYLSTARSRQISINLVVQSLGQLLGIYEENMTNTILADCATWMALACNDRATADLLEWRSGEATTQVRTVQHDPMEPAFRLTHRHSTGDGRRSFYTSNEIMKICARQECFIVWQQLDSLKCRAFPIFQHQEFTSGHMPIVSAQSLIPLSNKRAKRIFREWEEERVAGFRTWMENGGDPLRGYNIPNRKTTHGPCSGEDLPEIVNIHTLERMALAKASNRTYNPMADPDNPLYDPRYDPDRPEYDVTLVNAFARGEIKVSEPNKKPAANKPQPKEEPKHKAKSQPKTEPQLWDLSGIEFEMDSAAQANAQAASAQSSVAATASDPVSEPQQAAAEPPAENESGIPPLNLNEPSTLQDPHKTYPAAMPAMDTQSPEDIPVAEVSASQMVAEDMTEGAQEEAADEEAVEFTASQMQQDPGITEGISSAAEDNSKSTLAREPEPAPAPQPKSLIPNNRNKKNSSRTPDGITDELEEVLTTGTQKAPEKKSEEHRTTALNGKHKKLPPKDPNKEVD